MGGERERLAIGRMDVTYGEECAVRERACNTLRVERLVVLQVDEHLRAARVRPRRCEAHSHLSIRHFDRVIRNLIVPPLAVELRARWDAPLDDEIRHHPV